MEKRPTECCMYWGTAERSALNEFARTFFCSYIKYTLYTQLAVANLIQWVSVKIVQTRPCPNQYCLVNSRAQMNH